MKPTEIHFNAQAEPERSVMLFLRNLILQFHPEMEEKFKYKMPFYGISNKMVCYIWKDRKTRTPYLLVSGKIDIPELYQGDRKMMKVLYIPVEEDINIDLVNQVLNAAVDQVLKCL